MKAIITKNIEIEIKDKNQLIDLIKELFKNSLKYGEASFIFKDIISLNLISENCSKSKVSSYVEIGNNIYFRKERNLKEIIDILEKENINF